MSRPHPTTTPTPAIVTERAARPLKRWVMLLLCAAYVIPGWIGRDPAKGDELASFGFMWGMAQGDLSLWTTSLAGYAPVPFALPHWLGAAAIALTGSWLEPALASRIPFASAMALCLALVWYATYELARTQAAQPVAFAFGGQAQPIDYARTLADGAVLAFMATLGLILLGHEATAAPIQLLGACALLYGNSVALRRPRRAALVLALAPWVLAFSGPAWLMLAPLAAVLSLLQVYHGPARWLNAWALLISGTLAVAVRLALPGGQAWATMAWAPTDWPELPSLLAWFAWPAWPLAAWAVWQWRRHWHALHVGVPLLSALSWFALAWPTGFSQRGLLLTLPALAVLASFALPTLRRAVTAFVDWFSLLFFSGSLLVIWVYWVAMQTQLLPTQANTVVKLAPGFVAPFQWVALWAALAGLVAWLALVRWRIGRHPAVLWKSLVLAAGGVVTVWLTMMSLWLPALDYARSYRTIVATLTQDLPPGDCVSGPTLNPSQRTALAFYSGRTNLQAFETPNETACRWRIAVTSAKRGLAPAQAEPGWQRKAMIRRPGDRDELWLLDERLARK